MTADTTPAVLAEVRALLDQGWPVVPLSSWSPDQEAAAFIAHCALQSAIRRDLRAALNAAETRLAEHEATIKAQAWDEAAEATAEWMANNPGPSGIPHDPPRNPYEASLVNETSRPQGSSSTEGEEDGKQGGVRPGRTGQDAEGSDRRGLHGGSGVLAGSGPGPSGGCPEGSGGRELSDWRRPGQHRPADALATGTQP